MRKHRRLQKLRDTDCKRCNLYKSTRNVCILGRGNPSASIMLIGEAPGAAEEKHGQVFCGRAGRLLDRLLRDLNMQNLAYITNAVHCRPPDNRRPTRRETRVCRRYLDGELEIVKPKVIVLMGRTAIEGYGFGPEVNAGSKPFLFDEWWIKATWHPAYCLRRGTAATHDLFKALKWAKHKVWELNHENL